MEDSALDQLQRLLLRHEGMALKVYTCPAGHPTIGCGRALDVNGISRDEALMLLRNDIASCEKAAKTLSYFNELSEVRQAVIISMIFNCGYSRFLNFKKMIEAIKAQNWALASSEMLNSQWAKQTGKRANDLASMMLLNVY